MSKIFKDQQNIALANSTGHQKSSGKADSENKAPKIKRKKTDKNSQMPPKRQRTYKSAPMRTRVITKHIGGKSNREIAKEERIDRATVGRILCRYEAVKIIRGHRVDLLAMLPRAIDVYKDLLESKDEKVRASVASKIIEGLQVVGKDDLWLEPEMPEQENDGVKAVMGQIVEMMLKKHQHYGTELPSMFDEVDLGQLRRESERPPEEEPEDHPCTNINF